MNQCRDGFTRIATSVNRNPPAPLPKAAPGCPLLNWRRTLFAFLHRQIVPWWVALKLPEDRIVEISVHESL